MLNYKTFVFNPFQVNTYVVYSENNEALIIDAACYEKTEQEQLKQFISNNQLKPVKQLNTHCHVDHILGSKFIETEYGLKMLIHPDGESFLSSAKEYAMTFGLSVDDTPNLGAYLNEGDIIKIGEEKLVVLYIPGHADGSICLVNHGSKVVFTGDVIFNAGIGRTDLPTGNMDLLLKGIKEKLLTLPYEYRLLPGHGPETTVGQEKEGNPFLS